VSYVPRYRYDGSVARSVGLCFGPRKRSRRRRGRNIASLTIENGGVHDARDAESITQRKRPPACLPIAVRPSVRPSVRSSGRHSRNEPPRRALLIVGCGCGARVPNLCRRRRMFASIVPRHTTHIPPTDPATHGNSPPPTLCDDAPSRFHYRCMCT